MPRYALRLAYDGRDFVGAWRQPGRRSVLGELDAACARLGETGAAAQPAARTDAGVHARGNVVAVDLARTWRPAALAAALEQQLPPDLACHGVAEVSADWRVQEARSKTYRYRLDRRHPRDPQRRHRRWRVPHAIDEQVLTELAAGLAALTDASGFARAEDHRRHHPIVVTRAAWRWQAQGGFFTITADRFSLHLVRSLVGAQIAIASGRRPPADWRVLLAGGRAPAGDDVAPAHGLELLTVAYPEPLAWQPPPGAPGA